MRPVDIQALKHGYVLAHAISTPSVICWTGKGYNHSCEPRDAGCSGRDPVKIQSQSFSRGQEP